MPDYSAAGKHIVITGGTSGLGLRQLGCWSPLGATSSWLDPIRPRAPRQSRPSTRQPSAAARRPSSGPISLRCRMFGR